MNWKEYREAIAKLGLSQVQAAKFLRAKSDRTSRRWALGESEVPALVADFLQLIIALKLTPDKVNKLLKR